MQISYLSLLRRIRTYLFFILFSIRVQMGHQLAYLFSCFSILLLQFVVWYFLLIFVVVIGLDVDVLFANSADWMFLVVIIMVTWWLAALVFGWATGLLLFWVVIWLFWFVVRGRWGGLMILWFKLKLIGLMIKRRWWVPTSTVVVWLLYVLIFLWFVG